MEVRLHVKEGKANVKEIILGRETLVGRSSDCNLKITSSQVSRRHCRILVTDNEVLVTDLGSANGTLVNGVTLPKDQPSRVAPGNELEIGPLKFQVHYIAPHAGPSDETVKAAPDTLSTSPKQNPAPATAEAETVDFQLDQKRKRQLQTAVTKSAEDTVCPPTECLPMGSDDGQRTVMDLNLASPAPMSAPEFPGLIVDAVDDTVDLPSSARAKKAEESKPEKTGGFLGMFRRKKKDEAPKKTGPIAPDETLLVDSSHSGRAEISPDTTQFLAVDSVNAPAPPPAASPPAPPSKTDEDDAFDFLKNMD